MNAKRCLIVVPSMISLFFVLGCDSGSKSGCKDGATRCVYNVVEQCSNSEWEESEDCNKSNQQECVVAQDEAQCAFLVINTDSDTNLDTQTSIDIGSDSNNTGIAQQKLVAALDIDRISIYQTVEIPLMENGVAVATRKAPIIRDKDALLRIFVRRQQNWVNHLVTAKIEFSSVADMESQMLITQDSTADKSDSTFNFLIPKEYLNGDFNYRVSLWETGYSDEPISALASWPQNETATLTEESPLGPLKFVIVPILYTHNGLNSLPIADDSLLQEFQNAFYQFYPLAKKDLELSVRPGDPIHWDDEVVPDGTGWNELLDEIGAVHDADGADVADHYYYGLFIPEADMDAYCSPGCVAGQSWRIPDEDALFVPAQYRTGIGVAFPYLNMMTDTALHELGHLLGREHAPSPQTNEIDANYPYAGGLIGNWGFDLLSNEFKAPTEYIDLMGYGNSIWISDYTYNALFARMQLTYSSFSKLSTTSHNPDYYTILIDGKGGSRLGHKFSSYYPPATSQTVPVFILDINNNIVETINGYFISYSSLPGGSVAFQPTHPDSVAAQISGYSIVQLQ